MKKLHKANEQGLQTKTQILETGLKLWPNVTASSVAKKLNKSHATILYHFQDLKNSVAEYAVEKGCMKVIVQLIATNHKVVEKLSEQEKKEILRTFLSA